MNAHSRAGGEIELVLGHTGERALCVVETGSRARAQELLEALGRMSWEVRPIVLGPVLACALRAGRSAGTLLEQVAECLRGRYPLAICEPGFTPSIYRVALELARDSEGDIHPLPSCSACGAPEPFPTMLSLHDGGRSLTAHFCSACLAAAPTDAALLCRVLLDKAPELAPWRRAPLGEPFRDGDVIRFALHAESVVA